MYRKTKLFQVRRSRSHMIGGTTRVFMRVWLLCVHLRGRVTMCLREGKGCCVNTRVRSVALCAHGRGSSTVWLWLRALCVFR